MPRFKSTLLCILSLSLQLPIVQSCGESDKKSSLVSGINGISGGNWRPGRFRIGNISNEVAKFDNRINQGKTLEPEISFRGEDENGAMVEGEGQLDRTEIVRLTLPEGFTCIGQGSWTATGDVEVIEEDPAKCEVLVAFATGAIDPEGSVFFSGNVKNAKGETQNLNYRVNLSESTNQFTSLTNPDGDFQIDQVVTVNAERIHIGSLSAISRDGSSHHFVLPKEMAPPFNFTYPISVAVPNQITEVEYALECSVQQNREFFGAADFIEDLIVEGENRNCPFKITKMDYENRDNLSLQFELQMIEILPGRYAIDGLKGLNAGLKNKAAIVFEVIHSVPLASQQSLRVVQQFVFKINFLAQPADDVKELIELPPRPGSTNVYFKTAGQISALEGFEMARKIQNQLQDKYGTGVKFYAAIPEDQAENDWLTDQVKALAWIGAVDIKEEGKFRGREELRDYSPIDDPQPNRRGYFWFVPSRLHGGVYTDYIERPLPYQPWLPGEPNNRKNREHCVVIGWLGDPGWNDWRCDQGAFMLFELELTEEFTNSGGDNGPFDVLQ